MTRFLIAMASMLVLGAPPPTWASVGPVATGEFTGSAAVLCGGPLANYRCEVLFGSSQTCYEVSAGSTVGLGACRVRTSDGGPLITRGTATARSASCTTHNGALRESDARRTVVVVSPLFGNVDVEPTVTHAGTTAGGEATITGTRQALGYTLVLDAEFAVEFGCGQGSGYVSGTYTITAP